MDSDLLHLRIFVSSPNDVIEEHKLALTVIEKLNTDPIFRDRVKLSAVSWHNQSVPLPAPLTPQEALNQGLPKPSDCDWVAVILWSRMGTPLQEEHVKPEKYRFPVDSELEDWRYLSGTEYEYIDAMEATQKTNRPYVMVYRRTEEPPLRYVDPERDDKIIQWERVRAFFSTFTNPDGSISGNYNAFEDPSDFREKFESHLREFISRQLKLIGEETMATPDHSRPVILEGLEKSSLGRCTARWQALKVPLAEAVRMANNRSLGAPSAEQQPQVGRPLILIGDLGVGKSLISERLFQDAVARLMENPNAPVPAYLDNTFTKRLHESVERGLQTIVRDIVKDLGDPARQGATIILDGIDELGAGAAAKLLGDARILTTTWPNTTAVITSRPIRTLAEAEEAVEVSPLSKRDALELIREIAGYRVHSWGWPDAVEDTVTRPLFAVLLGVSLRDQATGIPRSKGELLTRLVEGALWEELQALDDVEELLQKLAVLSLNHDGPVFVTDIATGAELQLLRNSRLVVEQNDALSFALPILTQWFAAHSLIADTSRLEDLASDERRLERWHDSLVLATSYFGHTEVSKLLVPLAERNPARASEIVRDALVGWRSTDEVPLPSAQECGYRLREAMEAWTNGIGPLANLIAPIRKDGSLYPIGASTHGSRLLTGWYYGEDRIDDVVELPLGSSILRAPTPGWRLTRSSSTGDQPAWAWRWTLDELVSTGNYKVRAKIGHMPTPPHPGKAPLQG